MSILSSLGFGPGLRGRPEIRLGVAIDATAPAYPSVDPGVQARSADDILAAHQDLISRIKLCYGADRAAFEADLLTPIRSYAAFVNLLPATPDNFFCEVGGLFRLGLEVAFYPAEVDQPRRSDFGCPCCLRPSVTGSAFGVTHFRGYIRVHFRYGPVTRTFPEGRSVDRLQIIALAPLCYPSYGASDFCPGRSISC